MIYRLLSITPLAFSIMLILPARAQDSSRFHTSCYCVTNNYLPNQILELGNNSELLFKLSLPKTRSQLKSAGLKFEESQIELLKDWKLVQDVDNGSGIKASFPIFTNAQSQSLRQHSKYYASKIALLIRGQMEELKYALKIKGFSNHTFAILHSYVLDYQVWKVLEESKAIKKFELEYEHPRWNGEFWMMEGQRRNSDFHASSLTEENMSLMINWRDDKSSNSLSPILSNWEMVYEMLKEFRNSNRITNASINASLSRYKIFDESGYLLIPLIDEGKQDYLKVRIDQLTESIVKELMAIPLQQIKEEYSLNDNGQALIILYKELMWDILNQLIEDDVLALPKAYLPYSIPQPSDYADLMFLVKHDSN